MLKIILFIANTIFWTHIYTKRIKHIERALRQFYLPLRDEHPKEYFKQNKFIKFIRSHTGLSDYDNLHWVYIVIHYLQTIWLLGSSVILFTAFFITLDVAIVVNEIFCIITQFSATLLIDIFGCVQESRSKKIKKRNPKYANCEIFRWR